jgi:hypothetical protein
VITFPPTVDPEGTSVNLEVLPPLPSFFRYQQGDDKITLVSPKVGEYVIDVKLTDKDMESTSWKKKIVVKEKKRGEDGEEG